VGIPVNVTPGVMTSGVFGRKSPEAAVVTQVNDDDELYGGSGTNRSAAKNYVGKSSKR
jgi:hypothetical protein